LNQKLGFQRGCPSECTNNIMASCATDKRPTDFRFD
jgi:hypothetical protein